MPTHRSRAPRDHVPGPPPASGAEDIVESAARIVADGEGTGAARRDLAAVLAGVPVAVLLIDLASGLVTYANHVATGLTEPRLPVALDEWGAAARLTDLDGQPLEATANPLGRLATGTPVAGEAVRAVDATGATRLLWITGFPLSGVASEERLALVVMLEIDSPATDDPDATLALLRERAIIATDLSFTITDPRHPDNPLLWVNPAFTRVTGYTLEESVGRNCRFLQGPATDPDSVERLRWAVTTRSAETVTLLNYRRDGTAFWNQVSVSPVFDADGQLVSYVGVQADVTERVRSEAERERAYAAERVARYDAERARARLGLLAEAGGALAASLDVGENLERLADLVVPALADWVVVTLADEHLRIERTVVRHRAGHADELARYVELLQSSITEAAPTRRVLAGSDPILADYGSVDEWREFTTSEELRGIVESLGLRSVMYVPLLARRGRVLGAITLVSAAPERVFDDDDLAVATDLGRRAGLTFDNARLYEHEHRAAEILQRSLLPALPDVDGLHVAARYLPGDVWADVGGDFYELLPLPDGSIGVAVGDVVGHDLSAAAAMGHLRGLLRACAWNDADDGRGDPAWVLDRVDRLVQGLDAVPLATLSYGRLEPPAGPGGSWRFAYANAGHPPPLVRHPDGRVERLDGAAGVLLGVGPQPQRCSASVDLAPGSAVVGYTDGLVERRGENIDAGVDRVAAALAGADPCNLEDLVDSLVATAGAVGSDDTAVIAIRVGSPGS